MKKNTKQFTKFETAFNFEQLQAKLSGLTPLKAYHFTKRDSYEEFNNYLTLLNSSYVDKLKDKIESLDLVFSANTESPFILSIMVGRNDKFQGKEKYDIDVFGIAPNTKNMSEYFRHQWHHYKDNQGNRISYDINPSLITDEEKKKDTTYAVFLTGATSHYSLEQYENEKLDFYNIHVNSFDEINKRNTPISTSNIQTGSTETEQIIDPPGEG